MRVHTNTPNIAAATPNAAFAPARAATPAVAVEPAPLVHGVDIFGPLMLHLVPMMIVTVAFLIGQLAWAGGLSAAFLLLFFCLAPVLLGFAEIWAIQMPTAQRHRRLTRWLARQWAAWHAAHIGINDLANTVVIAAAIVGAVLVLNASVTELALAEINRTTAAPIITPAPTADAGNQTAAAQEQYRRVHGEYASTVTALTAFTPSLKAALLGSRLTTVRSASTTGWTLQQGQRNIMHLRSMKPGELLRWNSAPGPGQ